MILKCLDKGMVNSEGSSEIISVEHTGNKKRIPIVPPGFQLVVSADVVRQEQQELMRDRLGSYSEATRRAARMEGDVEDQFEREDRVSALTISGKNLAGGMVDDPLETYRREHGLDQRREELLKKLEKLCSFERGLKLFNNAVKRTGEQYVDMEGVNKKYPNITRAEMVVAALLKRFPQLLVDSGQSLDSPPKTEGELKRASQVNVSGVSTYGIEFSLDLNNIKDADRENPFFNAGIQGAPLQDGQVEVVDYIPQVHTILEDLVSLSISSQRLFERVWDKSDISLVDGFSKLDRKVVEAVLERSIDSGESLKALISGLSTEQKAAFEQERGKIDAHVARNILINPNTGKEFSANDVVKLIGILGDVPEELVSDTPFEGYVIPSGAGILFIDPQSHKRFYSPLHPHHIREALGGIHYESVDVSNYNHVVNGVMTDLFSNIQGKIATSIEQDGEDPSLLEGMLWDAKIRFGVSFETQIGVDLKRIQELKGVTSEKHERIIGYKIGVEELRFLNDVLRLVPGEFLENVKAIKKEIGNAFDLVNYLEGVSELAHYSRWDRSITLTQIPEKPFGVLSPQEREIYAFTVLHEIAHGAWLSVKSAEWQDISHAKGLGEIESADEFITQYAKASPEEDFAEHFAAYIFHAQEFREATQKSVVMKSKYEFMSRMFEDLAGANREYPQLSKFTIGELHDYATKIVQGHTLDEALAEEKRRSDLDEIGRRSKNSGVVVSLDKGGAGDVIKKRKSEVEPEVEDQLDPDIDEVFNQEQRLGYKSTAISDFMDYFAEELPEAKAKGLANRVYELIEDGEIEKAINAAIRNVDDIHWEEVEDRIRKIAEDIESGQDLDSGGRKLFT